MPTALPVRVHLVTEPLGILASLRAARRNVIETIPDIATKQPMVSGTTASVRWHMVMDPKALRQILLEKLDDYPKSDVTKSILEPAIGDSLFVAEGAHWRWQRRAAAPVFSHRNVQNLGPIMAMAAERSVQRVGGNVGRVMNLYDEMVATTFDVISDVTFSGDDAVDRAALHTAIERYLAGTAKMSLLDVIGVPTWVPRPLRLFSGSDLRRTKAIADRAIEARRARGGRDVPDLLDLLIEAQDPETKREMSTTELRDNLLAFIVAGHETTALTLAWALYLCAFDTDVQDKARQEARAVLGGRTATAKDVEALPYIRMVIDEAMRLYPPAAFLSRTAQKADTLCGRKVRAGDTVMLPIYALHRNELLWEAPDTFRPERFADPKAIDRYAYLPFGNGPRVCIGAQFAVQEAVMILATLLSKFRFTAVEGKAPRPTMVVTLRPEGGVWLQVGGV